MDRENLLSQREGIINAEQGMTNVHVAEYETSLMDIPCSTLGILKLPHWAQVSTLVGAGR